MQRGERKKREQESERSMVDYVNIMEAAQRCGVSDKTIRRWIHANKLRAHFPLPNRCEIAVSDLEPFVPGQLSRQSGEPSGRLGASGPSAGTAGTAFARWAANA
jgi:excisionase family DNA binding protein